MSGDRIPPLMRNSPKHWSFTKRWNGINSRDRGFSHRNNTDWYKQPYTDKEKASKTHYYNRANFKLHNTKTSFLSSSSSTDTKKQEPSKVKSTLSNSDKVSDKRPIVKENGISKDLRSEERYSAIQKSKSSIEDVRQNQKETTKNTKIDSEKENISAVDKLSSDPKGKDSDKTDSSVRNNKDGKISKELPVIRPVDRGPSSGKKVGKVVATIDLDSEDDEVTQCNSSGTVEKDLNSDIDCIAIEPEIQDVQHVQQNFVDSVVNSEMQIKITEVGSLDNIEQINSEIIMEVEDDKSDTEDNVCDETSKTDNQISTPVNTVSLDLETNKDVEESVGENLSENLQLENENVNENPSNEVESQLDSTKESSSEKASENVEAEEDSTNDQPAADENNVSENVTQGESNTASAVDEANEPMDMDNSTDVGSPKPLMIAESEDMDAQSAEVEDKNETNSESSSAPTATANDNQKEETSEVSTNNEAKEEDKNSEENEKGDEKSNQEQSAEQEKLNNVLEEVDLPDEGVHLEGSDESKDTKTDDSETKSDSVDNNSAPNNVDSSSEIVPTSSVEDDKAVESNENEQTVVQKKRRRKKQVLAMPEISTEDNGVRQKRRSAKNAEEMIRKEILKNDEDEDSADDTSRLVPVHYKNRSSSGSSTLQPRPLSPPSLKRTLDDLDNVLENGNLKRIRHEEENSPTATVVQPEKREFVVRSRESVAETSELVRTISQQDIREKLRKLTQEELEALLLQKIVENITICGEMGKLREQARTSKRNQEATRAKCQQLQKQVEGFEMVLKRLTYDKNANNDKYVPPIKINRSVGLQVNFMSQEHGIQNLKQIQAMKAGATSLNTAAAKAASTLQELSPRKMMKTRSPRRPDVQPGGIVQNNIVTASSIVTNGTATPTALVMSNKSADLNSVKRPLNLQSGVQLLQPGQQQQQQQSQPQTVIVNSNGTNRSTVTIRSTSVAAAKTTGGASDLIDLTDEEDKSKSSAVTPVTTTLAARLPRMFQAVPASVALSNPTNLRLVQTVGGQPTQTAIVNNPRLAYVMQNGGNGRQLVITNPNNIRPVTSVQTGTRNISTIHYKPGMSTMTNGGTVRVLTTQAPTANLLLRHPAPLPESPPTEQNPAWKLAPPAPSLKIAKAPTGIVLSWNMVLSDKFAEIVSYQLYAYQEVAGMSPSAALWKKVGDVRALPLPMACTLTQFTEGNNYYFAVRAVDIHSRFGQYSKPGNITL